MPPKPPVEKPQSEPSQPPRTHLRHHRFLLIAGIVACAVLAILAASGIWYIFQLTPRSGDDQQQRVSVRPGDSLQTVGATLEQNNLIRSSFVFYTYGRLQGVQDKLQAGTYVFSPSQSVNDILAHMVEGRVDELHVTILPGRTLKELKSDLKIYGFRDQEIESALSRGYDHPLLKDRPSGATLEGYIFPETYNISGDGTVAQLFMRAFDELERHVQQQQVQQKLQARDFNLHQGLILASIIQQEVPEPQDQRQVAQIFQKRLKIDMPLGADATFVYAAEQMGVEPRVGLDSPYNTRLYKGLPPGPIGSFNLSALSAVTDPAAGEYVYFVSGDDGTTHFAVTLEQHEQNIEKYCKELCKLF